MLHLPTIPPISYYFSVDTNNPVNVITFTLTSVTIISLIIFKKYLELPINEPLHFTAIANPLFEQKNRNKNKIALQHNNDI